MLTGKEVLRAGYENEEGKGILRAGMDLKIFSLKNFFDSTPPFNKL